MNARLVVVLVAVVAMMSPVVAVSSAQAAVASAVSLGASPSVAAPAESVVFSGVVSPLAAGRTVWLQRLGTKWTTVASVATSSAGRFSASLRAGVAGSKTSWRAVARPTVTAAQAISVTRTVVVVKASLSLSAPSAGESNIAFTLSGRGYPARLGRVMVVQRLSGRSWTEVGRTTQSSTGLFAVRTSVGSAGSFTYRALAVAWHGVAALASPSRIVAVHAPYILLTPSAAIAAETVKATGKLPGVYSRPVWVQRKSGASWVTLVKTTTSSAGLYSASFKAPALGSYALRSLAPQVTIAGKARPQYATAAKTLSVVAQTASLTLPTTLMQATTGTATLTFRPIRTGRAVALHVLTSGGWTAVATGKQTSTGTASFTVTAGTPATYSYRAWTAALAGAPAFASPNGTLTVLPAIPGSVSAVSATPTSTSIALSWTNPGSATLTGVTIRRAQGATPPASAADGTPVTDVASSTTSFTDSGVASGTQYSYALFAHNATPAYAAAATVISTTIAGAVPAVSATPASGSVVLSWTNPPSPSLTGVTIRRAPGATAPASATDGTPVSDVASSPSSAGSFTDRTAPLNPMTQYSYALFAHDAAPAYAAAAATITTTTTAIPGPVTGVTANPASGSVDLEWTNPGDTTLTGVMIRRVPGATAPASATDGTLVTDAASSATSFTDRTALDPMTQYSYALFAHDATPGYAARTTVTRVTPTPTTWSGGYGLFEDTQYLTGTALSARLDEYKAVGVQWARFQLLWSTIQSGGPTSYDWKPVDDLVAGLLARGIRPIAVIGTTPLWASRPAGCAAVTCAPADPAQFAAFAARASARYAPRGVHTWEVWNEPNSATFWKPAPDVASYTVVLKQSYAAIKAADPLATVITGGAAPAVTTSSSIAPLEFLAGIYSNGGQGSFDGVGWHPYTYPRMPGTVDNGDAWYQMYGPANSARAQMTAHGDAAKKIWATEFGAHTDPLGEGYVTEAGQAEMFRTGLTLWASYPWAGPMIGYMLRDRGTDTADRENFFGLTRYDGSPKPAYATFTSLVRDFAATHPTF